MDSLLLPSWKKILKSELSQPYFTELNAQIEQYYEKTIVYPKREHIFKAFELCPFEAVKVVLLGQDPYHNTGQAEGLSFSVPDKVPLPPSLRNIYKEISSDLKKDSPASGDLRRWAIQGVLLLNAVLTVEAHKPGSHQKLGWEQFTDSVITILSKEKKGLVFILWGNYAREKKKLIDEKKHLVLEAPHPSPLSAHSGFFGCKHFSKTNEYLRTQGIDEILW